MPKPDRHPATIAMVVLSWALSACAAGEARVGQFAAFAEAGRVYTSGMTDLLDASLILAIQADNRVLIRARELNGDQDFLKEALDLHERETREREAVLDQIREQTHLLERYFVALELLASRADGSASAKATVDLGEAAEKLARELSDLSSRIEGAAIGEKAVSAFLGGSAPLVIDAYQRKALDRVLEATAEPVSRSLHAHKAALEAIRAQMTDERALISEGKRSALIIDPYVGEGPLPADWGKNRLEWLIDDGRIRELDRAVEAADTLQLAFQKLLQTGADGPPFKLLIRDLKGLASSMSKPV